MSVRDRAKHLGEEAARIVVTVVALLGGIKLVPPAAASGVDLTPVTQEIAALRHEMKAELREQERRIAAVERALP